MGRKKKKERFNENLDDAVDEAKSTIRPKTSCGRNTQKYESVRTSF